MFEWVSELDIFIKGSLIFLVILAIFCLLAIIIEYQEGFKRTTEEEAAKLEELVGKMR